MQSLALSFSNFSSYLSRPVYQTPLADQESRSTGSNLRQFSNESALFLFLLGLTVVFSLGYTYATGNHLFQSLIQKYRTPWDLLVLLVALLLAVSGQEGLFRAILRMTQPNLRYLSTALLFILIVVWYRPLKELAGPLVGFGMIGGWLVVSFIVDRYLKRPVVFARVQAFWQVHFGKVFYATGLLYALFKITDDISRLTGRQLLFLPALFCLTLLSSFYFGYIRMKYGFWYAVAVHSLILISILAPSALRLL